MEPSPRTVQWWGDPLCPWSALAACRAFQAAELLRADGSRPDGSDPQVDVVLFPLGADPHGWERWAHDLAPSRVSAIAAESGWGEWRIPVPIAAHLGPLFRRLVATADLFGARGSAVDLWRVAFSGTHVISDRQDLIDVGVAAGLDAQELGVGLDAPQWDDVLATYDEQAEDLGISVLPTLIVGDGKAVLGPQPASALAATLRRVWATDL